MMMNWKRDFADLENEVDSNMRFKNLYITNALQNRISSLNFNFAIFHLYGLVHINLKRILKNFSDFSRNFQEVAAF